MSNIKRYGKTAVALHWAIAVLIIGNIILGHVMVAAPRSSKPILVPIHVWIGLAVLALSVFRLGWRLSHPKPPYPNGLKPIETTLAGLVQIVFYILMIGLPIVGYLLLSANQPNPRMALHFLGIIHIPFLSSLQELEPVYQKKIHDQFVELHAIGGWAMVACLVLHIAGVLKHYYLEKINLLQRMTWGSDKER